MKLRTLLISSFIAITFIPILIISFLLYKSGFDLSKESYTRNIIESINVQVDYISQTMENNMVSDFRFASQNLGKLTSLEARDDLFGKMRSYLEESEDKIVVCLLLDKEGNSIYTIGEKSILTMISSQLPTLSEQTSQSIMEFDLGNGAHSLGSITPIYDSEKNYAGSLISIYDKSYIFKTISSYYEITDSSTYICRENGDIISFRGSSDKSRSTDIEKALNDYEFTQAGVFDMKAGESPILGYYKNISNSPWYLVGVVDHTQIYEFLNKLVWVYIFIAAALFIVDILLAAAISKIVVKPINRLIKVIDGYPESLNEEGLQSKKDTGYFEAKYLNSKFLNLMKTIMRVQHNFEGVYQLYQSNTMGDTNIDINVKDQTIHSSKESVGTIMAQLVLPEEACIVERFTNCFCDKDRDLLMSLFTDMRDEHLSVTQEAEVFSPYFDQKWFHILVVPMYEADRLSRLFVQLRDITSFKRQEANSLEQVKRESLTGLYNRVGFVDCINSVIQDSKPEDMHALLFMDINDFKMVNDNFGHSAGDELLISVANALLEIVRKDDIVSRFGGDEFAAFLTYTNQLGIDRVCNEISRLCFPYSNERCSFNITISVGVATYTYDSPETIECMLKLADAAMYESKRSYKVKHRDITKSNN